MNEGVLRIPQSSSKTGTLPSDCLVSYPGHSLEGLSYYSDTVDIFNSPSRLDKLKFINVYKGLLLFCILQIFQISVS